MTLNYFPCEDRSFPPVRNLPNMSIVFFRYVVFLLSSLITDAICSSGTSTNVRAHSTTPMTVIVNWNAPAVSKGNLHYIVKWTEVANGEKKNATVKSNTHIISGLKISTEYSICVVVVYDSIIGDCQNKVRARTQELRLNVSASNISARAIEVYWNSISLEIHGYAVRYWAWKEGKGTAVRKNVSNSTNSLRIDNLQPFTVYTVQVKAFMVGKTIKGRANVSTDEGVPSAAPRKIACNKSSTSISVHWDPVPENFTNGVLCGYEVRCFLFGSPRPQQTITTCKNSVEFQGLKNVSTYLITVAGFTRKGFGVNSTVSCKTDEGVPSSPPTNISVRTTNQSGLEITWSRVPVNHMLGALTGYQVKLLDKDGGGETLVTICASSSYVKLSNLALYHTYCVTVTAFSRKGTGPESNATCVMVDDEAFCQPPENLSVRDVKATKAHLEWVYEGICATVGFVVGYRLTYSANDVHQSEKKILDANATSVWLRNLTPNTKYRVNVTVLTNNGKDSLPSNSVSLTTKERSKGISISGGKGSKTQPEVRVEKIFPGGAAADDGRLKSGDQILSVDGESLQDVTHAEAVDIIRKSYNNKAKDVMEIVVIPKQ